MTIRDPDDGALIFEDPQVVDDAVRGCLEDTRELPHMDPRLGRNRVEGTLSKVSLRTIGAVSAAGALRHK